MKRKLLAMLLVLAFAISGCGNAENAAPSTESESIPEETSSETVPVSDETTGSTQAETQESESVTEETPQIVTTELSSAEELEETVGCSVLLSLSDVTNEQFLCAENDGKYLAEVNFSCFDQDWTLYALSTEYSFQDFDLPDHIIAFADPATPEELDGQYPLTYFDSLDNPSLSTWTFQGTAYVLALQTESASAADDFFHVNDTIRNGIFLFSSPSGPGNANWQTLSFPDAEYNFLSIGDRTGWPVDLYEGDMFIVDYDNDSVYYLSGTSWITDATGLYECDSDFSGTIVFKCENRVEILDPPFIVTDKDLRSYLCENVVFQTVTSNRFSYNAATGFISTYELELIKDGQPYDYMDE